MKVLAAVSGGVDSAVAASRVVAAGHDVTAVHLALSSNPQTFRSGARGCCSLEDSRDARRVADVLGIPYYVWDLAERFKEDVVDDFLAEYAAGRTPNPCLRCNERIKFSAVLDRALALGFDAVCTGHYARIQRRAGGSKLHPRGRRGQRPVVCPCGLQPGAIAARHLPVGRLAEVRCPRGSPRRSGCLSPTSLIAMTFASSPTATRAAFLKRNLGEHEGDIVDSDGAVLGQHEGSFGYTVGQRKGLGTDGGCP